METTLPRKYCLTPHQRPQQRMIGNQCHNQQSTKERQPFPNSSPGRKSPHITPEMSCYQPVIKKQLFTSLDGSLRKDPYPVITVNHHNWKDIHTGVSEAVKTGSEKGLVHMINVS